MPCCPVDQRELGVSVGDRYLGREQFWPVDARCLLNVPWGACLLLNVNMQSIFWGVHMFLLCMPPRSRERSIVCAALRGASVRRTRANAACGGGPSMLLASARVCS